MEAAEKDEQPMLVGMYLQGDEHRESRLRKFSSRTRSASISAPRSPTEPYESEILLNHTGPLRSEKRSSVIQMSGPLHMGHKHENVFRPTRAETTCKAPKRTADIDPFVKDLGQTGGDETHGTKNEHLMRSGQLGICSDPYCTTCPTSYSNKGQRKNSRYSLSVDSKLRSILYGDAKGCARRLCSRVYRYMPGVMNPHSKVLQQWNKFFVLSYVFAIFLDPLFFFLLSVKQEETCIAMNIPWATAFVAFRSLTDLIYWINILLQFRLAYVSPESGVVGAGELVDHPRKIALNYLKGYFLIDFFLVLPLPQLSLLMQSHGATYSKQAVLLQYFPRLYRLLPFLAGQFPSGFMFKSLWANFAKIILIFVFWGHNIGSCWYLFGLQRVRQCLYEACHDSGISNCMALIDCGHGNKKLTSDPTAWSNWKGNVNATACFGKDNFPYGIYVQAVTLITQDSIASKYMYSLFWGCQQLGTLAGNQVPNYLVGEVVFILTIIVVGLINLPLLIADMQKCLEALNHRLSEMSLRHLEVEQWMSHRQLPEDLRRQVRQAERYNWAVTRGVNEEILLENLPEDLQREIRRHLFKLIKEVRIFALMDEPILDAICAKLRRRTYIKGSRTLHRGGLIEKMVFIVRGKMESIGEDGIKVPLSEGDVCGEELLTWLLEHSYVSKDGKKVRIPDHKLISNKTIMCFTNVEAFTLAAADLEEVTSLFPRFLRTPRAQGARYESPYLRCCLAAVQIQVVWRYRKKRLHRADISQRRPKSFNHENEACTSHNP